MFNQPSIIEFINKIINKTNTENKEEVEENLKKFRSYLELTQMCDSETLSKVDKVLACYDSLMDIKYNFGYVDVTSLFISKKKEESKKLTKKVPAKQVQSPKEKTTYEEKHYHHYTSSYNDTWSSGCGGSSGGGSYRSGC